MDRDVAAMSEEELRTEIMKCREAIRYHRDQKLHDRCRVDDVALYRLLPELEDADFTMPPEEEWVSGCKDFRLRCIRQQQQPGEKTGLANRMGLV